MGLEMTWWVQAIAWGLAALALVQTTWMLTSALKRRWVSWWRNRRAERGEVEAEPLLRRAGYRIVERQAEHSWVFHADGDPVRVHLRADLIVARGGQRFVAEVKTGRVAPDIRTTHTRRQILEYRMAYPVDGVLLVDMEARRIHEITFPLPEASPARWRFGPAALLVALALGTALGAGALWWLQRQQ